MLKNIILIEDEVDFQCDTQEEVVKKLIDENFYNLSEQEKKEKLKMLATANNLNKEMEIIENIDNIQDTNNKFILKDEITYIYSLLTINKVVMLERKEANIFTSNLDKSKLEGNYIIVNKFAKELLDKYIKKD